LNILNTNGTLRIQPQGAAFYSNRDYGFPANP
jgi:hypothetical protein